MVTSYGPNEQNQFLYATVPVRLALAALAGIKWLMLRNGDPAVPTKKNELLAVFFYDGLGGLALGWSLGVFNGRVPAYSS